MRKRNCDKLFDNIFWYTLYFLPVIILFGYFFSIYHDTGTAPDLMSIIFNIYSSGNESFALSIPQESLFYLLDYFYSGSHVGNALDTFAILCCGHFVTIYIFHLFVDFLLFIPRLCHKWMNTLTQGD